MRRMRCIREKEEKLIRVETREIEKEKPRGCGKLAEGTISHCFSLRIRSLA